MCLHYMWPVTPAPLAAALRFLVAHPRPHLPCKLRAGPTTLWPCSCTCAGPCAAGAGGPRLCADPAGECRQGGAQLGGEVLHLRGGYCRGYGSWHVLSHDPLKYRSHLITLNAHPPPPVPPCICTEPQPCQRAPLGRPPPQSPPPSPPFLNPLCRAMLGVERLCNASLCLICEHTKIHASSAEPGECEEAQGGAVRCAGCAELCGVQAQLQVRTYGSSTCPFCPGCRGGHVGLVFYLGP